MAKSVMGKYFLVVCHLFQVEGCPPVPFSLLIHIHTYICAIFNLFLVKENEEHMKFTVFQSSIWEIKDFQEKNHIKYFPTKIFWHKK